MIAKLYILKNVKNANPLRCYAEVNYINLKCENGLEDIQM